MVSIAVLDDGIFIDCRKVMKKVTEYLFVDEYGKILPAEKIGCQTVTHGGLCAYIIQDVFSDVEFTSIRILNKEGRGKAEHLAAALNWCLDRNYEIIHMSLTTNSYYDYVLLKPIVSRLISKKRILVSSLSNEQVVSYPAAFPGVFAAFMDNSGFLKDSALGVFYSHGINKDFVMVHYQKTFYTDTGEICELKGANSFAAAVLSGGLAQIIQNKRTGSEVTDYISDLRKTGRIQEGRLIRIRPGGCSRTIPVVRIENDEEVLGWIKGFFENKGYEVAAFCGSGSNIGIPLSFYLENEKTIEESFFENMETIYSPDMIILGGDLEKYPVKAEVECLVCLENHFLTLKWKNGKQDCFKNKDEALSFLELRLQEDVSECS
ncbi:MAG: S8 family serine peptidase [Dorea sp.]|jgi:hypothetical protein|nr:S8 family serine peptidase [Dorea sp.]MCI9249121.1 S8 family serine peptidase [Dorea sp.]